MPGAGVGQKNVDTMVVRKFRQTQKILHAFKFSTTVVRGDAFKLPFNLIFDHKLSLKTEVLLRGPRGKNMVVFRVQTKIVYVEMC